MGRCGLFPFPIPEVYTKAGIDGAVVRLYLRPDLALIVAQPVPEGRRGGADSGSQDLAEQEGIGIRAGLIEWDIASHYAVCMNHIGG